LHSPGIVSNVPTTALRLGKFWKSLVVLRCDLTACKRCKHDTKCNPQVDHIHKALSIKRR
jgi:hypothetical protein